MDREKMFHVGKDAGGMRQGLSQQRLTGRQGMGVGEVGIWGKPIRHYWTSVPRLLAFAHLKAFLTRKPQ
jgi:hypothetical protein